MDKAVAAVPEEQRFILSALSPSRAQTRLAFASVLALILALLITAGPLSTLQLGRIDAFVPIYATALIVTNLITAVVLFAQFSILRSHALLALAALDRHRRAGVGNERRTAYGRSRRRWCAAG